MHLAGWVDSTNSKIFFFFFLVEVGCNFSHMQKPTTCCSPVARWVGPQASVLVRLALFTNTNSCFVALLRVRVLFFAFLFPSPIRRLPSFLCDTIFPRVVTPHHRCYWYCYRYCMGFFVS